MHCVQDRFHTDTVWMKKRTKQFYYFQFHSQRSPITCNLRAHHLSAFFLITDETRIKALPESRQSFENALAQTSGLVNLVFTYQTGFSSMYICFNWQTNDHNWAACTKCIAIWPRFESVSEQHAAHAPERSYLILAEVFSNTVSCCFPCVFCFMSLVRGWNWVPSRHPGQVHFLVIKTSLHLHTLHTSSSCEYRQNIYSSRECA